MNVCINQCLTLYSYMEQTYQNLINHNTSYSYDFVAETATHCWTFYFATLAKWNYGNREIDQVKP